MEVINDVAAPLFLPNTLGLLSALLKTPFAIHEHCKSRGYPPLQGRWVHGGCTTLLFELLRHKSPVKYKPLAMCECFFRYLPAHK